MKTRILASKRATMAQTFSRKKTAQLHRIFSLTPERIRSKNAAHKRSTLVSPGNNFDAYCKRWGRLSKAPHTMPYFHRIWNTEHLLYNGRHGLKRCCMVRILVTPTPIMGNPELYASETWPLTLQNEYISMEFDDKVLMEILERWGNKQAYTKS
jgi:hypothetical protein